MIGTVLDERYRIDSELGQGGMGTVYRAHDTLLDRDVAVKVMSETALGTEGRVRLMREARATAQLNHPNIVSVYDAGETDPSTSSGQAAPFIVMELVEGESLHDRRPEALDDILAIARQVCAALDHAHAHGIIHRDLKPENVMILPDGTAKLMDFGLARSAASRLTAEGTLIGTVFYLAPEQALGAEIDHRADLYALGVTLYELTTGVLPFTAADPFAVITQHLNTPVVPPRAKNAQIPSALDNLIVQLLSKDPQDRPASAAEVLQALEQPGFLEKDIALAEELAILKQPRERPASMAGIRQGQESLSHPVVPTERLGERHHNLPTQITSFIGRQVQLAAVRKELTRPEIRLLTLTGAGGTGKTRLSLEVAASLLDDFENGVFFVGLAPVSDPTFVMPAIAQTLGVREAEGRPLLKSLKGYLREKQMLLVLDNFEQVTEAAPVVSDLLTAAPRLKVLAISRALLRVRGEHNHPVPPLTLPDPGEWPPVERLLQVEAVQLFVERARAVKTDFAITVENGPAVAEICTRLDGLPLAIELAAARVRLLPPQKLLDRLSDRFRLLTGGARDLPARHQTLRGAIDWSYDLLEAEEQTLFRRLAVFVGGCTLEAAEAVGSGSDDPSASSGQVLDVMNGLEGLVDKSLLQQSEANGEPRFGMLETIREYALERLADSGEAKVVRRKHANFFMALAEEAEVKIESAEQRIWLNRLETEHDNLQAILGWALEREGADAELGLRLATALVMFWFTSGRPAEVRRWLDRALERSSGASAPVRAKVLWWAGNARKENPERARLLLQESLVLYRQLEDKKGIARVLLTLGSITSDFEQATALQEQSLALCQELGDKYDTSITLRFLGQTARRHGYYERAMMLYEQSLEVAREIGVKGQIAFALQGMGYAAFEQLDYGRAALLLEESLTLARELGGQSSTPWRLNSLGAMAHFRGDYERAAALYSESLAIHRELGDKRGIAMLLHNLGHVALRQGDGRQAVTFFEEGLAQWREMDSKVGIAKGLAGLAGVAGAEAQPKRAARLFGTAEALFEITDTHPMDRVDQVEWDHNVAIVRGQLDEATFAAAWAEGRAMAAGDWEQVVAYALGVS